MEKDLKFLAKFTSIAMFIFLAGCECDPPIISSITPDSGPAGTIVEVLYTQGAISGTIIYEGNAVPTETASNIGIGKLLRFTIPYDESPGNKNIQVSSSGRSPAEVFNVTSTSSVPTPVLEGFEVPSSFGQEITVYGSGFSTLSEVYVDGVEVESYSGYSEPLRVIPLEFRDNLIICTPATDLTTGTSYDIQVKNPGGANSNVLNITVPSRELTLEFDAIDGIPVPDYYAWRDNTVNSLRRSYCDAGWIINLKYHELDLSDPHPNTEWSIDDMYSFWVDNADFGGSGYYMHGQFIPEGPGLGVMFMWAEGFEVPEDHVRQGFAVFWDEFSSLSPRQTYYLRTTIHEAGHGFNLLHGDASANSTIMTQTGDLVTGWDLFFSNVSRQHLRSHDLTDVAPGGTDFGNATCH